MIFPRLKTHLTDDAVTEFERLISEIDGKSHVSDEGVDSTLNLRFQFRSEQRMHTAAMKFLGGSKLLISHIEHLFSLFECDVVVRVPRAVEAHSKEGSKYTFEDRDLAR